MLIFAKYAYMLLTTIFVLPVILDPPTRHGATRALLSWQETAKSRVLATLEAFLDQARCSSIRVDPSILNRGTTDSLHPFGPNLPHFGRSVSPAAFCSAYLGETQLDFGAGSPSPSFSSLAPAGKEDQVPSGESEESPYDLAVSTTESSSTRTFREPPLMVAAVFVLVGIAVLVVLALFKWLRSRRSHRIVRIKPRRKQGAYRRPVSKAVLATPHRRHLHAVFLGNLEPTVQGGLETVWQQVYDGGTGQMAEDGRGEDNPCVLVGAEQVKAAAAPDAME